MLAPLWDEQQNKLIYTPAQVVRQRGDTWVVKLGAHKLTIAYHASELRLEGRIV